MQPATLLTSPTRIPTNPVETRPAIRDSHRGGSRGSSMASHRTFASRSSSTIRMQQLDFEAQLAQANARSAQKDAEAKIARANAAAQQAEADAQKAEAVAEAQRADLDATRKYLEAERAKLEEFNSSDEERLKFDEEEDMREARTSLKWDAPDRQPYSSQNFGGLSTTESHEKPQITFPETPPTTGFTYGKDETLSGIVTPHLNVNWLVGHGLKLFGDDVATGQTLHGKIVGNEHAPRFPATKKLGQTSLTTTVLPDYKAPVPTSRTGPTPTLTAPVTNAMFPAPRMTHLGFRSTALPSLKNIHGQRQFRPRTPWEFSGTVGRAPPPTQTFTTATSRPSDPAVAAPPFQTQPVPPSAPTYTPPSDLVGILGQISTAIQLLACRDTHSTNDNRVIMARQAIQRDLSTFSGDSEEWANFAVAYIRSTQACSFSNDENLSRLQKCLKGKAREVVQALLVTPENVPEILNTLEFNFGQPEDIVGALIGKAESASQVK
ncbi:unnamed protein product [Allacma fusca]|uniref:Uncharacterized protein n=1 Tax=Allacma fusca TaxID=39272 RepID=A0A8J2LQY0_9HEXA|nr:unnamed protein product [Allacma fusca]